MTQASAAQHGIWVASRSGEPTTAYHMPLVVRFDGELDEDALARACAAVMVRNPILATAIDDRDGVAHFVPVAAPELRIAATGESLDAEIAQRFDLASGPLARFALFRSTPDARPTLVFTAHHIVFDGHSKDLALRDLAAFYNAAVSGQEALLAPATAFSRWAADEPARIAAAQPDAAAYWRERFHDAPPVVVGDRILTSRHDAPGGVVETSLKAPEIEGLTRFEATLAGVHAVLFGYGNAHVTTAIDLATRTAETAEVVGPFVNELPVYSTPRGELAFAEFAAELRRTLRDIYPHRVVPLARAISRVRAHAALAPISVSYRKIRSAPSFAGLGAEIEWLAFNGSVRGDLQLQIVDGGDMLAASVRFSAAAAPIARGFVELLADVLNRVASDPTIRVDQLAAKPPGAAVAATVPSPREAAAPSLDATELADRIRPIWEEVLGVSSIDAEDDLFDLGGDSLTITQIIARMRKHLRLDVPIDAFFDDPTINGVIRATLRDS